LVLLEWLPSKGLLWRLLCNLIHVYFLLLANFPLSEAQINFGQRKEGYYITSANAIMTWTCTGNLA
jgi:hypothetical protein